MAPKIGYKLYVAALRAKRRADGKCIWCGRRKPTAGTEKCAPCSARSAATSKALRDSRKAAGQCGRCRKAVAPGKPCRNCRRERIARAEATP